MAKQGFQLQRARGMRRTEYSPRRFAPPPSGGGRSGSRRRGGHWGDAPTDPLREEAPGEPGGGVLRAGRGRGNANHTYSGPALPAERREADTGTSALEKGSEDMAEREVSPFASYHGLGSPCSGPRPAKLSQI